MVREDALASMLYPCRELASMFFLLGTWWFSLKIIRVRFVKPFFMSRNGRYGMFCPQMCFRGNTSRYTLPLAAKKRTLARKSLQRSTRFW